MLMVRKMLAASGVAVMVSGCATFQGGMPNLPFNVEDELGIVQGQLKDAASVKVYYDAPSVENRNKFIASRLVITNIEYLKFIKSLSAEEAQIHSATDVLVFSLDVLATASTVINAKTALSGLSSMVGGARLSIDKNAFHEKTMSALISAMNAQRKDVLKRILKGNALDLNGYSFEHALSDINDYYLAGTINGALMSIQKDSAVKEDRADAEIRAFSVGRDVKFVDSAAQARVDAIISAVDKLGDDALFGLIKAPPVTDQFVDSVVSARDPQGLRNTNRKVAVTILKMRIMLSKRTEDSLAAWEAAVKSVSH